MEIDLRAMEAGTQVTLLGDCAYGEAQPLAEMLAPMISEDGHRIIIDLSKLKSLDSSGLSTLINIVTRARVSGAHVILVGATGFVAGVFEVTRLDRWFDMSPTVEEALKKFA